MSDADDEVWWQYIVGFDQDSFAADEMTSQTNGIQYACLDVQKWRIDWLMVL